MPARGCENIVSGIARDLLAAAMLRIEAAGYPIVLHVHDEIACEVPIGFGSPEEFLHLMTRKPAWALDLPIAASAWTGLALLQMKKGEMLLSNSADNRALPHPRNTGDFVMTLLASDFDQSKYLKASDLGPLNSEKRVKIKAVTVGKIGEKEEIKACVQFTNTIKELPLNKTNLRTLQGDFGNDMEAWAGKVIVLFSTMVELRGKMVPGLRIRIPPPRQATAGPATAGRSSTADHVR